MVSHSEQELDFKLVLYNMVAKVMKKQKLQQPIRFHNLFPNAFLLCHLKFLNIQLTHLIFNLIEDLLQEYTVDLELD